MMGLSARSLDKRGLADLPRELAHPESELEPQCAMQANSCI